MDPSVADWSQEKRKLIQKVIEAKSAHQQCLLDLQKTAQKCKMLKSEKVELDELCADLSSKLNSFQIENENLKIQCSKKESESIAMVHDNKALKARLKQLQSIQSQKTSENDAIDQKMDPKNQQTETYDIEKIVGHKKKKDGLQFCVRWKGFSAKDDTWENESELLCSLCEYKKKHHLN